MKTVPTTPTPEMLDAAVEFAMRVAIHRGYTWPEYMTDLYKIMIKAAPNVNKLEVK